MTDHRFSHFWSFMRGICRSPMDSPYKGSFHIFSNVRLAKLVRKQSSFGWFKTSIRQSANVTSLWCTKLLSLYTSTPGFGIKSPPLSKKQNDKKVVWIHWTYTITIRHEGSEAKWHSWGKSVPTLKITNRRLWYFDEYWDYVSIWIRLKNISIYTCII